MKIAILSREDLEQRHREIDETLGEDPGCGGTWGWSGPPCGGCVDCAHGMVSHSFHEERAQANRYQAAGLEWAPYVLDWYSIVTTAGRMPESHDRYGHLAAGEIKK